MLSAVAVGSAVATSSRTTAASAVTAQATVRSRQTWGAVSEILNSVGTQAGTWSDTAGNQVSQRSERSGAFIRSVRYATGDVVTETVNRSTGQSTFTLVQAAGSTLRNLAESMTRDFRAGPAKVAEALWAFGGNGGVTRTTIAETLHGMGVSPGENCRALLRGIAGTTLEDIAVAIRYGGGLDLTGTAGALRDMGGNTWDRIASALWDMPDTTTPQIAQALSANGCSLAETVIALRDGFAPHEYLIARGLHSGLGLDAAGIARALWQADFRDGAGLLVALFDSGAWTNKATAGRLLRTEYPGTTLAQVASAFRIVFGDTPTQVAQVLYDMGGNGRNEIFLALTQGLGASHAEAAHAILNGVPGSPLVSVVTTLKEAASLGLAQAAAVLWNMGGQSRAGVAFALKFGIGGSTLEIAQALLAASPRTSLADIAAALRSIPLESLSDIAGAIWQLGRRNLTDVARTLSGTMTPTEIGNALKQGIPGTTLGQIASAFKQGLGLDAATTAARLFEVQSATLGTTLSALMSGLGMSAVDAGNALRQGIGGVTLTKVAIALRDGASLDAKSIAGVLWSMGGNSRTAIASALNSGATNVYVEVAKAMLQGIPGTTLAHVAEALKNGTNIDLRSLAKALSDIGGISPATVAQALAVGAKAGSGEIAKAIVGISDSNGGKVAAALRDGLGLGLQGIAEAFWVGKVTDDRIVIAESLSVGLGAGTVAIGQALYYGVPGTTMVDAARALANIDGTTFTLIASFLWTIPSTTRPQVAQILAEATGATNGQIAYALYFGVPGSSLVEVADALKRGRGLGMTDVARALWKVPYQNYIGVLEALVDSFGEKYAEIGNVLLREIPNMTLLLVADALKRGAGLNRASVTQVLREMGGHSELAILGAVAGAFGGGVTPGGGGGFTFV